MLGTLDILIANDFGDKITPNLQYRNDYPLNKFTEIGASKNFNFGINGMGIGACDVNADGFMDYLITNIQAAPFCVSQGPDAPFAKETGLRKTGFINLLTNSGIRVTTFSWGVHFFDIDHDMDSDLYITNGSLNPPLAPNPNLLLVNEEGIFVEYGFWSRTNDHSIGRGSVVFDYDNDGDLDILVVNQNPHREGEIGVNLEGSKLYRNDNTDNNWIKIKLEGRHSEYHGIGARVEAHVGEQTLIEEVYGGSSHQSQNSTIVHFGLGSHSQIDSVVVYWPGDFRQTEENVNANQQITIVEGDRVTSILLPDNENVLLVSPSPFRDRLHIQYEFASADAELLSLDIFDSSGKLVHTFPFISSRLLVWEVPDYIVPGLYFLRMTATNGVVAQPIIRILE